MGIIIYSCSNDDNILPDDILYSGLIDAQISSIDTFVYIGTDDDGDCDAPVPRDSSAFFDIDLNMDGVADFKIKHFHKYGAEHTSMHSWCAKYHNYYVNLDSYNENQICMNNLPHEDISNYIPNGEPINNKIQWESGNVSAIQYGALCECNYSTYSGKGIIGLRLNENGTIYYGWMKVNISLYGFTIYDYAVNMAANKTILAGQME